MVICLSTGQGEAINYHHHRNHHGHHHHNAIISIVIVALVCPGANVEWSGVIKSFSTTKNIAPPLKQLVELQFGQIQIPNSGLADRKYSTARKY